MMDQKAFCTYSSIPSKQNGAPQSPACYIAGPCVIIIIILSTHAFALEKMSNFGFGQNLKSLKNLSKMSHPTPKTVMSDTNSS